MLCPWSFGDARVVTLFGLGYISVGPWLKQILLNLNKRNVLEDYEGKINSHRIDRRLCSGQERAWKAEKEISQQWSHVRDIHVIMSECQRLLLCLVQLRSKDQ